MEVENYMQFMQDFNNFMFTFSPAQNHDEAYKYLKDKRKLTDESIKKFHLMYCKDGDYQGRIIVPYYQTTYPIGFNSRLIGADKTFLKEILETL
jgi:hypothetical protein